MSVFSFPYRIGPNGTTATAGREAQIRDMVEQVLFTRRGERVNRPQFGAGMHEMLFSENAPEIAAAAQHMIQAALQQYLSGVIDVRSVRAEAIENLLSVQVAYSLVNDPQQHRLTVEGRL